MTDRQVVWNDTNRDVRYTVILGYIRGEKRFVHFGALGKTIRYNYGLYVKNVDDWGIFVVAWEQR